MGGFFGAVGRSDVMSDVFFGVDYHSHLGTKSAGLAAYDAKLGLQRKIHNILNSPFRTKFENIFDEMRGTSAIGCINDTDPQPLLVRSRLGRYAICFIGVINNAEELIDKLLTTTGNTFNSKSGGAVNTTELLATLIDREKSFVDGIKAAWEQIDGTACVLILKENGNIIAARDKAGKLPIHIGKSEEGYSASFEAFAYRKLGYNDEYELAPSFAEKGAG